MSCVDGYLFADHISFDSFKESTRFQDSVTAFEKRFERLPEYVAMDQIYGSRENRNNLKEKKILASVQPLGRPKQDNASTAEERWRKKSNAGAIVSNARSATAKNTTTSDGSVQKAQNREVMDPNGALEPQYHASKKA